ncbi:snaclec 3-like [Amphibalanus amphitrite]|uniref:snaclec 3-like n=1 Tax=Amphibalanus amphitrite TaxID=1232801 RepID=UPI001C90F8BE|nr:snaclec 3-like [Amphibalanus amphitrite]
MELVSGVSVSSRLPAVVALLSAAAALWPVDGAAAAVSGWPLQTYELETEAEVRRDSCPSGWRHDGHQCLMYVPAVLGWEAAQRHCEDAQAGAALASVTDVFQMSQLLLRAKRAGQDQVWIGLSGEIEAGEAFWGWADGSPLEFQVWEEGTGPEVDEETAAEAAAQAVGDEPQLCAAFSTRRKSWRPVPCDKKLRFFCGYMLAEKSN